MSAEKLTFVYDIPVKKFKEVLQAAEIENKHFKMSQFEKNYSDKDVTWCMLFNDERECIAAAAVQRGFGPALNYTFITELQCLKSGYGYGKKMLQLLKKKYRLIWLCADPEVRGDALLKIYGDPQFNFSEYVISAEDSIHDVDTHMFAVNSRMPREHWMNFLLSIFGKQDKKLRRKEGRDA